MKLYHRHPGWAQTRVPASARSCGRPRMHQITSPGTELRDVFYLNKMVKVHQQQQRKKVTKLSISSASLHVIKSNSYMYECFRSHWFDWECCQNTDARFFWLGGRGSFSQYCSKKYTLFLEFSHFFSSWFYFSTKPLKAEKTTQILLCLGTDHF